MIGKIIETWKNTEGIAKIIIYLITSTMICSIKKKEKKREKDKEWSEEKITNKEIGIVITTGLLARMINEWKTWENWKWEYKEEWIIITEKIKWNINITMGMDNISYWLIITTIIITIISSMIITETGYKKEEKEKKEKIRGKKKEKSKERLIKILMWTNVGLIGTFLTRNILTFYICFEIILIPIFILIGCYGGNNTRIKAGYQLIIFTLGGSFALLIGMMYIWTRVENLDFTTIGRTILTKEEQVGLAIILFIPFAIKIPMWPVHIWLPVAHAEAPTIGSVILASIMLKLGGYGIIRIIQWLPEGFEEIEPWIYGCSIIGIIYSSIICIYQTDLKRIIAYTSVAHMNLMLIGLTSKNVEAISGAYYLMLSHSISSAALFYCIGIIYNRYQTRNINELSGISETMPLLTMYMFIFTLSNMSAPLTPNFIGEFLIFEGISETNPERLIVTTMSIILSAIYSIWMMNRVSFGTIKIKKKKTYIDINRLEWIILTILLISTIIIGLSSEWIITSVEEPIRELTITRNI